MAHHTWYLVQVDPNAMILCITVEKHPKLQEWVRAIFDTRDQTSRRKGCLFDIAVKIFGILVQYELSKLAQLSESISLSIGPKANTYRKLLSRPNLGHIKGVKFELDRISFVRLHHLDISRPFDFFSLFNGIPKIPLRIIRIDPTDFLGFSCRELLLPVLREKVIFDVNKFASRIDPDDY
jgi:hypothetical protein